MTSPQNIIRVFPRRTRATPDDAMAFVGDPPLPFMRPEAAAVHVSCTFSWDLPEARRLRIAWSKHYPHSALHGPALQHEGQDFTPGMYLKPGYVMTSRGCPNRCEGCLVPEREGRLRTLPITEGHDVCDNNILACPRGHIEAVLEMLSRQAAPARLTGGLEARRVTKWFAEALSHIRLDVAHTAYDRPADRPYVQKAIDLLREANGWNDCQARHKLGCYILVAYDGDTIQAAEDRIRWLMDLGPRPFPMFYQPPAAIRRPEPAEWKRMLRPYRRPSITYAEAK